MKYIILTIFSGFMVMYSWLIFNSSLIFKNPFPLYKFPLRAQNYFDWLGARVMYVFLAYVAYWMAYQSGYQIKSELKAVAILFAGFLIDYLLIYNQPYGYLSGGRIVHDKPTEGFFIPLSYSLAMGISLLVLAVIAWTKY